MIKWPLATDAWDDAEINAMKRVIKTRRFTMGSTVEEFEERFGKLFNAPHAVMVNSGSSANLLMAAACSELGYLRPGDEIIVPAVGWSTSYFPFHQIGCELVFIDVNDTWNIDVNRMEQAIRPKTRAVLAVNLLGNPCAFDQLIEVCDRHDLILLEDNCESLGATYDGKCTGTFGLMGSFSTFFSHHIQTMEGGIILCDEDKIFNTLKSLRSHGWTRNTIWDRGNTFEFKTIGYNVRPGELHAAVGLEQLNKWKGMDKRRARNAHLFRKEFGNKDWCDIQKVADKGNPSWFGFGILFHDSEIRDSIENELHKNQIETRPIVSGNFTRQPVFEKLNAKIEGPLDWGNRLHDNGFFLGNSPIDLEEPIKFVSTLISGRL